ncbi:MAG TPA: hypothetical protein VLY21_00360 [Nitrososphaerales archaeon]|nr:hypothetical protein [Nitrososphaerales archaeon]
MQNIDPILLLQPALSTAIVVGAIFYARRRGGFRGIMLLAGAMAYWIAIAAKVVVSYAASGAILSEFGGTSVEYALFLGLQTVVFEVGLAYLVSLLMFRRKNLTWGDAVPMGLSLSFWENGVLLGALPIVELSSIYLVLAGGGGAASTVYGVLSSASPGYFYAPSVLLPGVLLGTLERLSSTLGHASWGILCVLSATSGRKRYLAYALPMGLLDSLVPFASGRIYLFEGAVFVLSVLFVSVAARSYNSERRRQREGAAKVGSPGAESVSRPFGPTPSPAPPWARVPRSSGFAPFPERTGARRSACRHPARSAGRPAG